MKGMSGAAFIRHDTLRKYEEYVLKWGNSHSILLSDFKRITKQCDLYFV